jgi:hypothetical protein
MECRKTVVQFAHCEVSMKKIVFMLSTTILIGALFAGAQRPLQEITISYTTRTGQVWPRYIAQEGGYYEK